MKGKFIDISGENYKNFSVVKYLPNNGNNAGYWECVCKCGSIFKARGTDIRSGHTKGCPKCSVRRMYTHNKFIDLTGKVFGSYMAIKYIKSGLWECKCKCGNITVLNPLDIKRGKRYSKCNNCIKKEVYDNLIGAKFGKWEVIDTIIKENFKNRAGVIYKCKCECGKIDLKTIKQLKKTNSCTNCRGLIPNNGAMINRLYSTYKRHAIKRGLEWAITKEYFTSLIFMNCYYTNLPPSNTQKDKGKFSFYYNGVDRFDNKKGYTVDNCVPCNGTINTMKMDLDYEKFIEMCKLVVQVHENKKNITLMKAV